MPSSSSSTTSYSDKPYGSGDGKFHFAIDRGGTFTDVHAILPNGNETVCKLLSVDPSHYNDAPTEGIRRVLQQYDTDTNSYDSDKVVNTTKIGSIRMGTTVATNALLERQGSKMALLITSGFHDLLEIGNQSRPDIFDLTITKPSLLYEKVIEIDERIILETFVEKETEKEEKDEEYLKGETHVGVTGEKIRIIQKPNLDVIKKQLIDLIQNDGIKSIAICLLHSYIYPEHEKLIGELAKSIKTETGESFEQISLSSQIMPMIKVVSRGHTACASAYLTPKITSYLSNFINGFDSNLLSNVPLTFMKSDGGLASYDAFGGHEAILSGPAGGVIGYGKTSFSSSNSKSNSNSRNMPVIGFDMGGTSTDVSRYNGKWELVFETITAGVSIQAPQLDINTVAAGGGSRLFVKHGLFVVGPESAGAHPGPVCYRKDGYLAVTDANLILGRILPKEFPSIFGPNENEPLDLEGTRNAFEKQLEEFLKQSESSTTNNGLTVSSIEELAYGFIQVANEAMCRPIRNLTQMKGHDITIHKLACFGGAGPQHACAMAKTLGMKKVFIHRYGGILSAYGLSMADAVHEEQEPSAEIYSNRDGSVIDPTGKNVRNERLSVLENKAKDALVKRGYDSNKIVIERYLNMRYQGTDNAIMIQEPSDESSSYGDSFRNQYEREFGFTLHEREILIDDYRVRAVVFGHTPKISDLPSPLETPPPIAYKTKAFFENGWENDVCVYKMDQLKPGHVIEGPAIIVQNISTIVLELNCTAIVTVEGDLDITVSSSSSATTKDKVEEVKDVIEVKEDPVKLSIFAHRFMGIAEQMGRALQRTAISVNMKERLDFSCALFTKDGGLVANAPHIPVHLGAMQEAVTFQVQYWNSEGREGIKEGEVLVSNHPQLAGGSHLPDITVITPVFHNNEIIFFVASRGHHADIGGVAPGSMPPHSKCLEDEGACIVAFKLVKDGIFQEDGITEILQSPGKIPGNFGTRNLRDNLSDLRAQVAANNTGIRLLQELVHEHSFIVVESYMKFIQKNAELAVRTMLKEFISKQQQDGDGIAHAIDYMDDGTPIELTIKINKDTGDAIFDFTGTGPQVLGNINAPPAVTYSAVIYTLRSLVREDIPLNQGCLAPITFVLPKYCLLNPSSDAGVVGGNVLTSQRVVDVVLKAFQACAASQGCMNNLTFGDDKFGYYETIAGGAGAGPTWNGRSGVHTHCTNTRITDPEILEKRYPVLLRQFALRNGSGGIGNHKGGDGVVREIEPLRTLVMSMLSERRTLRPYGLEGGLDGSTGRNLLIKKNGLIINMGGKCSGTIEKGERLRVETPGGGGWGRADTDKKD